jgi:hypothetical protein
MGLGTLKTIELREAWKHEANDFTKWLAEPENLHLLADEIGFDIKLVQMEAEVGDFKVDILAEEENTGRKIIIENQLEITNHGHLGQIITYASGYNANVVVWIIANAREEHRRAIDWLNEHTDENIEFYLVKIELWQIGDSPYAPKFDILSKPNDWAKTVKESIQGELSDTKLNQLEFWNSLREYGKANNSKLRFQKPFPQSWTNLSIGDSDAHLSLTINSTENQFRTELYIPNNKDLFAKLLSQKSPIEAELGQSAEWMELPGKKASRIRISMQGDFENKDNWESYFAWLIREAEKFQAVFPKYVKNSS